MSLIDIIIPSESHEGTTMKVQTWLKQPGDVVVKDEPIVEMETDKVTLEIEAPVDGVLSEILVEADAEVSAEMVIGRINIEQNAGTANEQAAAPTATSTSAAPASANDANTPALDNSSSNKALSPSVKRFVLQHSLNADLIPGTGKNNRVTLNDAKAYLAKGPAVVETPKPAPVSAPPATPQTISTPSNSAMPSQHIPHSSMRRSIADHMSASVTQAPHVTAIFEVDFTAISAHRAAHKAEFAERGVKLTYTAYFLMACVEAMKAVPEINSQWHDDSVEVFSDINIGVGTALGDKGLVVPVVNRVQEKNLFGTARELQDITERARTNKLSPADMRGGTFTISNHGVSGSLLATPIIINQPQSAILGVGKLEKRVVVRSVEGQDVMLIKPMAYVSLSIDHRVIDGHQTNTWLSAFVAMLENWPSE